MSEGEPLKAIIRPIEDGDGLNWLSLGDPSLNPLKSFLKKEAKRFHAHEFAKTFVVILQADLDREETPPRVAAYLTLLCSEIQNYFEEEGFPFPDRYPTLPAVKLARMAVDQRYQGYGLGSYLMDWCIAHIIDNVMPAVGCRFLVVDAKATAVSFYDKAGFTTLDTKENRESESPLMFIDLAKLREQYQSSENEGIEQQDLDLDPKQRQDTQ